MIKSLRDTLSQYRDALRHGGDVAADNHPERRELRSTDSDLKQTLTLIYENAGTIPHCAFSCRTAPTRRRRWK